jgi:hypothetical protein
MSRSIMEATVRTTVDIAEDVLLATKELALQQVVSMGKVLSDLARQALAHSAPGDTRAGVPLFPVSGDGAVVTLELVNRLRDEAP